MIIYKVTNTVNGKIYIGQTVQTLEKRKDGHEKAAFSDRIKPSYFLWALREHGLLAFEWEILQQCNSKKELNAKEIECIQEYNSDNPDIGYNSTLGGSGYREKNIRSILDIVPEGLAVNRKWLYDNGISRPRVDYALRSNNLTNIGWGTYRRQGPPFKWQNVFYSLKKMGYKYHIGGESALKLNGFGILKNIDEGDQIYFWGNQKLPKWVFEFNLGLVAINKSIFYKNYDVGFKSNTFGTWDWHIEYSNVERGLIEETSCIKTELDFQRNDLLFKSAKSLNHDLVQDLLENCNNVATKRMFLWFAQRHELPCLRKIVVQNINLGNGKRQIIKGGKLDKKYQITVPTYMPAL